MNIRLYKKEDFPMIQGWYAGHKEWQPSPELFTEDSSFILENEEGKPWLCWILYLTNCQEMCWLEGLISNPELKEGRRDAIVSFHSYIEKFAKDKGYKKIFAMSATNKITALCIEDLKYTKTCGTITTFIKELE
jgi:hypothetical protein